jgi:hypothetical protein
MKSLNKAIKVSSVTITTVTVKCDRCKVVAYGQCNYPNHEMFVQRELKYTTIKTNRTSASNSWPKEVIVCPSCMGELESLYLNETN